jgi:hypothetical protein
MLGLLAAPDVFGTVGDDGAAVASDGWLLEGRNGPQYILRHTSAGEEAAVGLPVPEPVPPELREAGAGVETETEVGAGRTEPFLPPSVASIADVPVLRAVGTSISASSMIHAATGTPPSSLGSRNTISLAPQLLKYAPAVPYPHPIQHSGTQMHTAKIFVPE